MGLLGKIKASTLMETLVATVLIVIIFVISSFVLNNLFGSAVKNDTNNIGARLIALEYFVIQQQLEVPYEEEYKGWTVSIQKEDSHNLIIEAFNETTGKTVIRTYITHEH